MTQEPNRESVEKAADQDAVTQAVKEASQAAVATAKSMSEAVPPTHSARVGDTTQQVKGVGELQPTRKKKTRLDRICDVVIPLCWIVITVASLTTIIASVS